METNEKLIDEQKQEYRNQLATVTDDGKRKWVYPKKPSGKFYNARTIVSFFFACVFGCCSVHKSKWSSISAV